MNADRSGAATADTLSAGTVHEHAPAKVNLCLRVTGKRADGFHTLDSIAVFTAVGDRVSAGEARPASFRVTGPMSGALDAEPDNLVTRAARHLALRLGRAPDLALVLDKHLPVASGIGGGSSDAAAALRALARLWEVRDRALLAEVAAALGSDVPVCLDARPARMRGRGEILEPVLPLPALALVLVNPGVPVPTASVFKARAGAFSEDLAAIGPWRDARDVAEFVRQGGNDLTRPAISVCPLIEAVLGALADAPGTLAAALSGSGGTCFAVFEDLARAQAAAADLSAKAPSGWWIAPTDLA